MVADARAGRCRGARADERRRERGVALGGGPVQRRHAVALRRVDVGVLLQQRANRRRVAAHRGIRNRARARARARRGRQQQDDPRENGAPSEE